MARQKLTPIGEGGPMVQTGVDLGSNSAVSGKILNVNPHPDFFEACEKANTKPTRRQFSKWRNRKGSAFKAR